VPVVWLFRKVSCAKLSHIIDLCGH
jgi:hypothetical protein